MPAEVVTLRFDVEDRGSRDVERIERRTGALDKRLDQLSGRAGAAGAAMDKLSSGPMGRLASRFSSVEALAATATAAIVALSVAVAAIGFRKGAADALAFSAAMAEVSTLVDDASVSISALGDDVRNISVQFGQDPTSQARAVYQGLSAGAFEAADSIGFLTDANRLAQAGVTDVATSVEGLLAVMKPYQVEADRAAEISDKLFLTVKRGITTIPELAGALGQVTPLASQVGLSIDELLGAIAAITSATKLSTTETTTQISALLRALLQASERTRQVAADTGIAFDEIFSLKNFREKGLIGFLGELDEALKATGAREETLFKLTGRAEALNAVLALTGPAAKDLARNIGELGDASGTAAAAADKVAASTAQRFKELGAAFDDLLATVATQFLDVFAEFAPSIKAFLVEVTTFIRENSAQIKAIIHGTIEVATIAFKALYVVWDLTGTRAISLAGNFAVAGTAAALLGTSVAGATAAAKANAVANAANKNALSALAQASFGVLSKQQALAATTKAGTLSSKAFWTSMAHGAGLALVPLEAANLTLLALTAAIKKHEEALRKFNSEKEKLASDQSIRRFNAALAKGSDAQVKAAFDSVRQSANLQEIGTTLADGTRQNAAEYGKLRGIIDGNRASIHGLSDAQSELERQTTRVGGAFSQLDKKAQSAIIGIEDQLEAIQRAPGIQGRDAAIEGLIEQIEKLKSATKGLKDSNLQAVVNNYTQALDKAFEREEAVARLLAARLAEAREQALADVGAARFDFLNSEPGKQRSEKLALDLQPFELKAAPPSERAALADSQRAEAQRIAEERLRREVTTLDEQIAKLSGINEATKERNSLIEQRLKAERELFDFQELARAAAVASAAEEARKLEASRAALAVKMEETDLARRLASLAEASAPESSTLAARLQGEQAIVDARVKALEIGIRQAQSDEERVSLAEERGKLIAEQNLAAREGQAALDQQIAKESVGHQLAIQRIRLESDYASFKRTSAAEEITSRKQIVDIIGEEFRFKRTFIDLAIAELQYQSSITEDVLLRAQYEEQINALIRERADLPAVQAYEEKRRTREEPRNRPKTPEEREEEKAKAIQRAWEEVADTISGAATNAVLEFVNGTKTAEQAFKEFALNVLQYIQRLIIELLIAAAIQAALGVPVGGTAGGLADAIFFHDGGPVRKYHSGGLASDEVPAILQTGEYVVSRQGVSAAGLPALHSINRGEAPSLAPEGVARVVAMGVPSRQAPVVPAEDGQSGGAGSGFAGGGASGGRSDNGGVWRMAVVSDSDAAQLVRTPSAQREIRRMIREERG